MISVGEGLVIIVLVFGVYLLYDHIRFTKELERLCEDTTIFCGDILERIEELEKCEEK